MTDEGKIPKGKRLKRPERAKVAADLAERYTAGASIRDLAREMGRSYGFIHRILTENKVTLRDRGGARLPKP